MKLAITRLVLWFLVSIVLFQTLRAVLNPDASWRSYAALAVSLAALFLVYTQVIFHVKTSSNAGRRSE
jgi:hypothetical protein